MAIEYVLPEHAHREAEIFPDRNLLLKSQMLIKVSAPSNGGQDAHIAQSKWGRSREGINVEASAVGIPRIVIAACLAFDGLAGN